MFAEKKNFICNNWKESEIILRVYIKNNCCDYVYANRWRHLC